LLSLKVIKPKQAVNLFSFHQGLGCHSMMRTAVLTLYGDLPYNSGGVYFMHAHKPSRTARIEARIAQDALNVVKRAAAIAGRSVSDFIVAAAHEVACRTIEETQFIHLSVNDQRAFVDALLNPPPLSPAMERAREAHARLIEPPQ
jgi:uncharacterized protein (DUF1778 family)